MSGEVRFDAGSRALYATDGSNYRQVPIGVVVPKSKEDVIATVAVCRRFGAPLLSRGGGTSLAGQCCNVAMVIDWSKYLHHIVELNPQEQFARVQPGTVCDTLRNAAKPHTLTWGPDPATHDHCTFGGMLGNNSCGVHAQMAGKAGENVLSMDILLYDGTQMTVGWMDEAQLDAKISQGGREGKIYEQLKSSAKDTANSFKRNIRASRGGFRATTWTICCQARTVASMSLAPWSEAKAHSSRFWKQESSSCTAIPREFSSFWAIRVSMKPATTFRQILEHKPIGFEGLDNFLINNVKKKGMPQVDDLSILPEGKGWLVVEFGAGTVEEAEQQARDTMSALGGLGCAVHEALHR